MLHPPKKDKIFNQIIFRNDDVGADTNVEHFKQFCELFHEFGFVQLHAVTLRGNMNLSYVIDNIPCMYKEIHPMDIYEYDKCVSVSKNKVEDNKDLIDYLNSIPDPIALHGLYHTDYSSMTYEQQYNDIKEGLSLLNTLFPNKKIDTFVAPFNRVNEDTYKVCKIFNLRVSSLEGEHLEDRMHHGKGPLYEGELYRYHHHRFYPESTFDAYDLSIEKLRGYFEKYSYNFSLKNKRSIPSNALKNACGLQDTINKNLNVNKVENIIYRYIKVDENIVDMTCADSQVLFDLYANGYNLLVGYSNDDNRVKELNDISRFMKNSIKYHFGEIKDVVNEKKIAGVIYIDNDLDNKIYNVFHYASKVLDDIGYIIISNCKESEADLIDIASEFNAMLMERIPYSYDDTVYVFKRIKPKICLLCDRPNWAHDNSAQEIKKYLSDEFDMTIKYVVNREELDVNSYDAFVVFFWGEKCYQKKAYSKNRIVKQVSSHRWQFDKPYGPLSVEEFANEYLSDADTIICPSKILYDMLIKVKNNVFLCGKGYAPEKFYLKNKRDGDMSICMVGNLKDPIKGVQDILIPATEGYKMDMEQFLQHEELLDFYNNHDIYVVASVHEADPLPLIESMACGCFPIASKIGIAPELIRHKENGYLVEERTVEAFKEAIKWCEQNLEYIREQSTAIAKEIYETRRWDIMSENYRKMFRNHVGRK